MLTNPEEVLLQHLDAINRIVAFICRRNRVDAADAEDFGSTVRLRLIEDDYRVLRAFQERSSFTTYMNVVIQRMFLDYRIRQWGKWHPSAGAERLGDDAVRLENLLHRDGRTLDEAIEIIRAGKPELTAAALRDLSARLPPREPRRKTVDLDEARAVASACDPPDAMPESKQSRAVELSAVIRRFIDALAESDQLLLRLRFGCGMSVAQIARSMHLDQKRLYRQLEALYRRLREGLTAQGFTREEIDDVTVSRGVLLDFRLGNAGDRPSMQDGGNFAAIQKEIPR